VGLPLPPPLGWSLGRGDEWEVKDYGYEFGQSAAERERAHVRWETYPGVYGMYDCVATGAYVVIRGHGGFGCGYGAGAGVGRKFLVAENSIEIL
jgi:hypothetical protein